MTTPSTTSSRGLIVFVGIATVASLLSVFYKQRKDREKKIHRRTGRTLTEAEEYVARSIRVNMPPARRMGITVENVVLRQQAQGQDQQGSVSLSMPIQGNTNIHGSGFAGSLYSVCVLSAWYTLVMHLRQSLGDEILEKATVVIKSAEISYRHPVWKTSNNEYIVATSYLSSNDAEWEIFLSKLKDTGKTTCNISGEIIIYKKLSQSSNGTKKDATEDETTVRAVEFKGVLCALIPPSK